MSSEIATFLIIAGIAVVLYNLRAGMRDGRRLERDPERALAIMRGFRRSVIGLALVGIGSACLWEVPGLFTLSLLIAGEELLESTVMILALKDGPR